MDDATEMMDDLTKMAPPKKGDGFAGQVMFFLPEPLRRSLVQHPLGAELHTLHTGWFPAARHHAIDRPRGVPESILIFCTKGGGWFEIGGKREVVRPGQALLIPAHRPHRYGADAASPWSIYWMHFAGNSAAAYAAMLPTDEYTVNVDRAQGMELRRQFRRSLALLAQGLTMQHLLAVSHILRDMLGQIFFGGHGVSRFPDHAQHNLATCIRLMQENLQRRLTLPTLARAVNLSPSRFSAIFRARTGLSPVDYHIRLRIQSACHLLDVSHHTIKEIAARCGYEDPYYFSRIFRKVTGLSPLDYRNAPKG